MARILVTGRAGLIGCAVVEALARRGDEVAALDLAPGDRCAVRLDPADITAWPAGPAGPADPDGSFAAAGNADGASASLGASARRWRR